MAETDDGPYRVGFGKPPRSTQFKPGQSGNPHGRPVGAKNFATAIDEELRALVPVTENGKRKRISKQAVIAKTLVNKAAGGDLKAIPILLNEMRALEKKLGQDGPVQGFDAPEDQKTFDSILQRLWNSRPHAPAAPSSADESAPASTPPQPDVDK